jgi:hypothetical protein
VRVTLTTTTAVIILLLASAVTPALADRPARAGSLALVSETAKVTLPELSFTGPAFNRSAIAWTGVDAAHHLNVRDMSSPLQFGAKTTFPETSFNGPALAMLPTPGGSAPILVFAWTGTDAGHSLNVQVMASPKLTLDENSDVAPALAFGVFNGQGTVVLAWTGVDPNHSLNVLPLTLGSGGNLIPGKKTVFSQFSSNAGPSLTAIGGSPNTLVLGWSAIGSQALSFFESTDLLHISVFSVPETSAAAPQFSLSSATNGCVAWTGRDPAHHLNVECTAAFPTFSDAKTVLPDTALGAPGFSANAGNGCCIAWTGTDPAHHLNVAQLQGL